MSSDPVIRSCRQPVSADAYRRRVEEAKQPPRAQGGPVDLRRMLTRARMDRAAQRMFDGAKLVVTAAIGVYLFAWMLPVFLGALSVAIRGAWVSAGVGALIVYAIARRTLPGLASNAAVAIE